MGLLTHWARDRIADILHYGDALISAMASQITSVSIVCSTVCSGADQRKHLSSAALTFVRGIQRWPEDSPQKGPVTRKMLPFADLIVTDDISNAFSWMKIFVAWIQFYPYGVVLNKPVLVKVVVWRRIGAKPLLNWRVAQFAYADLNVMAMPALWLS